MDDPMLNIISAVIAELRDDDDVAAIAGNRIRHKTPLGEVTNPSTGAITYPGDVRGSGEYIAFVVVFTFDDTPVRRVPVQFAEIGFRAYGVTSQQARQLYGAIVKCFQDRGPRIKTNGLGIYRSAIVSGGSDDNDPKTGQPLVVGNIQLIATTVAVT